MRAYEFNRDERVLTTDDVWRRLFARVAPNIRRDIIGWLRLDPPASPPPSATEQEAPETLSEKVHDVWLGASLALDLLPDRQYDFYGDDRAALAADVVPTAADVNCIYVTLEQLNDRIKISERPPERPGSPSPASRADKSAAA